MGYEALDSVLYRELSVASGQDVIDVASPLLVEMINFATNAFQRCADASTAEVDIHLPLLMLYLHLIEMADGVEVLIKDSAPTPGILLIRSMFEAVLSMEYILEEDYEQRAMSWLTFYALHQLRISKEVDPNTKVGAIFHNAMKADRLMGSIDFDQIRPMAELKRANLERLLSKDHFKPIVQEAESARRKRIFTWHGLFGGPRTIRSLSKHLHREAEYLVLYEGWSQVVHGVDISGFLSRMAGTDPESRLLRNPKDIRTIASFAATFLLGGTRIVIGRFRPSEDISRWYKREVQQRYLKLLQI